MKTERLLAVELLTKLLDEKKTLNELLDVKRLACVDKPSLVKALCFGVCRFYFELDAIAQNLVKKRPKDISVWCIILSGLYQLKYLDMPDYAIIKESVSLANRLKKQWAKGFINAVLRNYCRNKASILASVSTNQELSHPNWFVKKIQNAWPNHWQQILKANNIQPPMTLRVNCLKTSVDDYLCLLAKNDIKAFPVPMVCDAIILSQAQDVSNLPFFYEGYVSIQDASPQLAADILKLKKGVRVLDACCAPGGKTCHLLERGVTELDALDIDEIRLLKLKDNLNRLKLDANIIHANLLDVASWWSKNQYDRILLDAPCSATGVIRRHPDIKILRTQGDVDAIRKTQKLMLESLWPLLKPGGYLLYATCSILPEENDEQIERFIKTCQDAISLPIDASWGVKTPYGRQILPGFGDMDGFYYSLLKKPVS